MQKSIGDERLTDCVDIKSGILLGCVMSGFLFFACLLGDGKGSRGKK